MGWGKERKERKKEAKREISLLLAYVGRPRESLLASATVQVPGALSAQSWSQTRVWMDSREPSVPVTLAPSSADFSPTWWTT